MATATGLVQRLKWASGVSALFVYIGPNKDATQLLLLMFDVNDDASLASSRAISGLLTKARHARLPVSAVYNHAQSTISSVDLSYAPIQVDGIEITQAIQTLANTVPLIADKGTVARVYLSSRLSAPITVRGVLRISRSGEADSLVPSNGDVVLNPADFLQMDVKRNSTNGTLNFLLPANKTVAGMVELRLDRVETTAGVRQSAVPVGMLDAATFAASPPLRITVVGFSYTFGTPPRTFTPAAFDFDLIQSWLRRAYPAGNVIWSQRVVTANAAAPFNCGDINTQLAAIRSLDVANGTDARTHYYGVVADGGFFMRGCAGVPSTPNPAAVGSGPTGAGTWGWDFDGSYGDWYCGHELGHTFGRLHPGFCGETADDLANYPFTAGQLSNADGVFAGFDIGDAVNGLPMAALPGTQWHDVMTYCNRQWISSYTYSGIRQRLVAEDALSPGPGMGMGMGAGRPDERNRKGDEPPRDAHRSHRRRLVQVVARVNLTRPSGTIDYVLPLDRGEPSTPDASSHVVIESTGSQGEALERFQAAVTPVANEGHDHQQRGMCSVILALSAQARGLRLLVGERVVDEFAAGAAPVAVTGIKLAQDRQHLVASWVGVEAGQSTGISYDVQKSSDGGRTWQTIAVGSRTPEALIDRSALSGDGAFRLRIRTSNGFEVATTEIELKPEPPDRAQME